MVGLHNLNIVYVYGKESAYTKIPRSVEWIHWGQRENANVEDRQECGRSQQGVLVYI